MTAKEFVKLKIPTATSERHVQGMIRGLQEIYWLIRERGKTMYFATGKTESNAWVNAKKKIIENEKALANGSN